jgi:hypothetical protein
VFWMEHERSRAAAKLERIANVVVVVDCSTAVTLNSLFIPACRVAMLPSSKAAARADEERSDEGAFAVLPRALLQEVLAKLPPCDALACMVVRKSWHAVSAESTMWQHAALRDDGDIGGARGAAVTEALLRGCAALAARACGGGLRTLCVSTASTHLSLEALREVVGAHSATLRELTVWFYSSETFPHCASPATLTRADVEALLLAAPRLTALRASIACDGAAQATALLRNEAPFERLRLASLRVTWRRRRRGGGGSDADDRAAAAAAEAEVLDLSAAMSAHEVLRCVKLHDAPLQTRAALDAVVDAALTRRIEKLRLASAPALARLLRGGALLELDITNGDQTLLDAPAAQLLADALRCEGAHTLDRVGLRTCRLWLSAEDAAHAAVVLDALAAHPSVSDVQLCGNIAHGEAAGAAAGAAVATLISRAPALQCVNIDACNLGSEGLGAVMDALADGVRRSRATLDVFCTDNGVVGDDDDTFVSERVLPALRASTRLTTLLLADDDTDAAALPAVREAHELVAARTREDNADAAAAARARDRWWFHE